MQNRYKVEQIDELIECAKLDFEVDLSTYRERYLNDPTLCIIISNEDRPLGGFIARRQVLTIKSLQYMDQTYYSGTMIVDNKKAPL